LHGCALAQGALAKVIMALGIGHALVHSTDADSYTFERATRNVCYVLLAKDRLFGNAVRQRILDPAHELSSEGVDAMVAFLGRSDVQCRITDGVGAVADRGTITLLRSPGGVYKHAHASSSGAAPDDDAAVSSMLAAVVARVPRSLIDVFTDQLMCEVSRFNASLLEDNDALHNKQHKLLLLNRRLVDANEGVRRQNGELVTEHMSMLSRRRELCVQIQMNKDELRELEAQEGQTLDRLDDLRSSVCVVDGAKLASDAAARELLAVDLDGATRDMLAMGKQVAATKGRVVSARAELSRSTAELSRSTAELSNVKGEMGGVQASIASVKEQTLYARARLSEAEADLSDAWGRTSETEGRLAIMLAQVTKAIDQLSDTEATRLQLAARSEELADLRSALKRVEALMANETEGLSKAQREASVVKEKLASALTERRSWCMCMSEVKRDRAELCRLYEVERAECVRVEAMLRQACAFAGDLKMHAHTLQQHRVAFDCEQYAASVMRTFGPPQ
jgi:chromosome segregation ATPase